jgi:hypothetical protein
MPDDDDDGAGDDSRAIVAAAERRQAEAAERYGWGSQEARAAGRNLLDAQRESGARRGTPYARPLDLGVRWDAGAPLPFLVSGYMSTFVAFYLPSDFEFDGTNPRSRSADDVDHIGVVQFEGVVAAKIGSPNDEVLRGHPLWGHGLELYEAHLVENSAWLQEIIAINRVHARFTESAWRDDRHYLFAFHDETFECIASEHHVTVERGPMVDVAARLAQRALRP